MLGNGSGNSRRWSIMATQSSSLLYFKTPGTDVQQYQKTQLKQNSASTFQTFPQKQPDHPKITNK